MISRSPYAQASSVRYLALEDSEVNYIVLAISWKVACFLLKHLLRMVGKSINSCFNEKIVFVFP